MSWNGESRAIKEALQKEHRIEREMCPLCQTNYAHVCSRSVKYKRVVYICMECAKKFIEQYKDTQFIPADKVCELLYCDNLSKSNYGSIEIEQQMRLF